MAESAVTTGQGRTAAILLAILAVLGWGLAIYFWADRGSMRDTLTAELEAERSAHAQIRTELATLEETAGSREELDTIVAALRTERDQLEAERGTLEAEFAAERQAIEEERGAVVAASNAAQHAVEAELAGTRQQLAALRQMVELRDAETRALTQELAPLREEIGTFDTRLAEAETNLVARTQELSGVGERLEAARAQEAEIQAQLARLTEDGAAASREALEAEERLQAAREAEAQLEVELAAAREAFAQIAAEQAGLEEQVRLLEERRTALTTDTEAARQQRTALQSALDELAATVAARGEDVQRLETRMAELQAQDAAFDRAVAAGILPGQYMMGPISARFSSDGRFDLAHAEEEGTVTGRYAVEEGSLVLDEPEGEAGWIEFPVACTVQPEAVGFSLHGENGDCALFSGALFELVR